MEEWIRRPATLWSRSRAVLKATCLPSHFSSSFGSGRVLLWLALPGRRPRGLRLRWLWGQISRQQGAAGKEEVGWLWGWAGRKVSPGL